jgi:peptide/nickel transport system ATP-binding protein
MCDRVAVMYAGEIVEQTDVKSLFASPKHPYTQGLIGSVPILGSVQDELATIPGAVPNLIDLPPACRFAPRCVYAGQDDCTVVAPELREIRPGHWVRSAHPASERTRQPVGVS